MVMMSRRRRRKEGRTEQQEQEQQEAEDGVGGGGGGEGGGGAVGEQRGCGGRGWRGMMESVCVLQLRLVNRKPVQEAGKRGGGGCHHCHVATLWGA